MAHQNNTKIERICFRVEGRFGELLKLLSNVTGMCPTDLARDFFFLGIDSAFTSYINRDLIHWEFGFEQAKRVISGTPFIAKIDDVIRINKFKENNETN